ncbi:MAG TPA: hypothetical protein VII13_09640 [Vicinamibacteria bacterium]|jgi:hypothetical protein
MRRRGARVRAALAATALAAGPSAASRAEAPAPSKPFVVEYYYKAKWGHFDEFLRLFKKNHYPVLLKEKEMGRIVRVDAVRPRYHATEDGRWDLRVTIAWRDAATASDGFDPAPLVADLFPDKAAFEREEQRRFELLLAHWDLPLQEAPLDR